MRMARRVNTGKVRGSPCLPTFVPMTVPEKITALRRAMLEQQIDAYIIPSTDPHQSEYVADRWAARAWISGFTGSAGTVVVTLHDALLWTDSRYFTQAETELAGTEIKLMKLRTPHVPEFAEWLGDHLISGQTVGVDGRVFSLHAADRLRKKLEAKNLRLTTETDLIQVAWKGRPAVPARPVFEHTSDFSGEDWQQRLIRLAEWVEDQDLDYYLVSGLDDLAWLLNLRGEDIDFNPLAYAYLLVGRRGDNVLFADQGARFDSWSQGMPEGHALTVKDYGDIAGHLRALNADSQDIGLDPATASAYLGHQAGGESVARHGSPIPGWKAVKNDTSLDHLREAMRYDAVALLRLRRWLDEAIETGVDEHEVAEKLTALRADYEHYVDDSFPAIVGYRGNGAIIHYRAPATGSARIDPSGLLLLDSGGQYRNGTTDITRTFALGEPTEAERTHFTLVLKGMIDLSRAAFPVGTAGVQLDVLARLPLWKAGLNYGHGTGHGVGYFLNVHEGPAGIHANPKSANGQYPIGAGMIFSNEPGYYPVGEYGIRIENLVVTRPAATEGFLEFETLTLFPIDRRLVDTDLLGEEGTEWLNAYHQTVFERVAPLLQPEEADWLRAACARL